MAKQVITKEQKIKGKIVHVELVETEPHMNVQKSEEAGTSEQESGTVLVSGLPEGVTENGVHIHFQKKKNGGGEIKEVTLLSEKRKAIVVFEDMKGSFFPVFVVLTVSISRADSGYNLPHGEVANAAVSELFDCVLPFL